MINVDFTILITQQLTKENIKVLQLLKKNFKIFSILINQVQYEKILKITTTTI